MLMGAFFGILGRRHDSARGSSGSLVGDGRRRRCWRWCTRSSRSRCAPTRSSRGTAINFLALGITGYLFIDIYGEEGTPDDIPQRPDVHLPLVEDIPFVGDVIGQLNLLIWVALLSVPLSGSFLFRTPRGLRLRSVGENPRAADTVGIAVYAHALPAR